MMRWKTAVLYTALFGFVPVRSIAQDQAVSSPGLPGCGITLAGAKLIFASAASPQTPCIYRVNDFSLSWTTPAQIALAGSGAGLVLLYIAPPGVPSVMHSASLKLAITGGNVMHAPAPEPVFPPGSIPLAAATVKDGQWIKLEDRRPIAGSRDFVTAGKGIASINNGLVAIDSTVPQIGASNAWIGQNDFSVAASLIMPRKNGDPSTGCNSPGDVGKVYVRADGPAGDNLWICENNGGSRHWAKLMTGSSPSSPPSSPDASSPQAYFVPGGRIVDGGLQPLTPMTSYFYPVLLPYPMTVHHLNLVTGGGGTAAQALAAGIYDSNCKLLNGASGRAVGLASQGQLTITLSAPIKLSPGTYYFGYATDSPTATFNMGGNGVAEAALLNLPSRAWMFTGNPPAGSGSGLSLPGSCGAQSGKAFPVMNFAWLP
jgi:hypothetical protein